jgi:hypothetical protein
MPIQFQMIARWRNRRRPDRSSTVQASLAKSPPNEVRRMILAIGWTTVLLGVLAMQWADGRWA